MCLGLQVYITDLANITEWWLRDHEKGNTVVFASQFVYNMNFCITNSNESSSKVAQFIKMKISHWGQYHFATMQFSKTKDPRDSLDDTAFVVWQLHREKLASPMHKISGSRHEKTHQLLSLEPLPHAIWVDLASKASNNIDGPSAVKRKQSTDWMHWTTILKNILAKSRQKMASTKPFSETLKDWNCSNIILHPPAA
jgi:hypothetical protein